MSPQTFNKSLIILVLLEEEKDRAVVRRTQEAVGTLMQTDCRTCSPQVGSETLRGELDLPGYNRPMGGEGQKSSQSWEGGLRC